MRTSLKIALLLGAVIIVAGAGLGYGQMEGPRPPDGPMQGLMHSQGRLADRLRANFDLNHDGKITRAEMNGTIGARFAAATHHAPTMTLDQFIAAHTDEFRSHTLQMFHRLDWNGDGKVTLEDYAAPQRVRFMTLDRDGAGWISCARDEPDNARQTVRGNRGARGSFGLAAFCFDNDTNRDGKVTRSELDSAIAKRFAAATSGAATMNASQYAIAEQLRFRVANERTFRRLDKDGDGKLTLAEFAASQLKLFARLDKNQDGVIAADEMQPKFHARGERHANARQRRDYD